MDQADDVADVIPAGPITGRVVCEVIVWNAECVFEGSRRIGGGGGESVSNR